MKSLTVLIPTFKRPDALRRNLGSIVQTGVIASEVIVGDDFGDEATCEVCDEFSVKLPLRRLEPVGKGSLATNITRLLKAAQGEWILLIHDDDFLTGNHSIYPEIFDNEFDFFFTDHWISDESGIIDHNKTKTNSILYRRNDLTEGLQLDYHQLISNQSVCLDGFYARSSCIKGLYPDAKIGRVADFFWVQQILTSNIRIGYSKEKLFAYTLSSNGLTAQGLNEDIVIGYKYLKEIESDSKKKEVFENLISLNTWYAVNECLRRGDRKKAWNLLKSINFIYSHSIKKQIMLPFQILWLLIPKRL